MFASVGSADCRRWVESRRGDHKLVLNALGSSGNGYVSVDNCCRRGVWKMANNLNRCPNNKSAQLKITCVWTIQYKRLKVQSKLTDVVITLADFGPTCSDL